MYLKFTQNTFGTFDINLSQKHTTYLRTQNIKKKQC